jgi:hypothetical protein
MTKAKRVPLEPPSEVRTVYGYLLAEEPDEIQIGLWRKEIAHFCDERGYELVVTFVDRGIPHEQVARTGFTALLDVLELDDSYGVVVPGVEHLSGDNHAVATLRRLIRRTASQLLVIREAADNFKADGA